MKSKIFISLFLFSFFLALFFLSCKKEEKTPPPQPLSKSIELDLSFFNEPGTGEFYEYAVSQVSKWQILLNDSLNLQHDLFNSILDKIPVFQSDNVWLTTGKVNYDDYSYDVDFFTIVYSDSLQYKLFFTVIRQTDTIRNLLTFDGISYNDNTFGYWNINKPDTSNTYKKFLDVEWGDSLWTPSVIKFTNSLSGNNKGNYILFKDSADNTFTSYLDLFDKESENHTVIQWNNTGNEGRIKDKDHFGDTDWRYWNNLLEDTKEANY